MSLVRFVCIVLEDKLSRTNAQSGTSLYGHPDRLQDLPCLLSLAALTYSSRLIGAIESGSQVIYWFQIETRRRGEKGWVERDKNKKSKRESSPSVDTSICSLGRLVFSGWTEVEGPIQRHPSLNFFRADDSNLVTEHKNLCTLMWWDNLAFFLLIVFLKKLGHRAKKFMLSKTNFSFCPGFLQGFHHPFFSILSQPPNWSKKKFHLWLDQPPTHPNLSLFPPPQKKKHRLVFETIYNGPKKLTISSINHPSLPSIASSNPSSHYQHQWQIGGCNEQIGFREPSGYDKVRNL